jgi:NADPH-dependent 2,4-dienoyl-CoA reductase/sulfur reductase-like enzyme
MRLLVVGGSDAGISAALRARELDADAEITVVLEDDFPNYSICGLPFFISGETPDWRALAHRTEFEDISILQRHRAERVDAATKQVEVSAGSVQKRIAYDRLLISTGARPRSPAIRGLELPGVFPLHTMDHSFRLHEYLESAKPSRVVIVGAGYIGLEMADALAHRGLEVMVVGRAPSLLPTVDPELGEIVGDEVKRNGVAFETGVEPHTISHTGKSLKVTGEGWERECDMVLIAVGVQSNSEFGTQIGIPTGAGGALQVDRQMRTVVPDVYVAGDCGETWHRLLKRNMYLPLGTTAHKQGRVAGENMLGGGREFAGSLGTQVVKVFDLVIARTGLRQDEAANEGLRPVTTDITVSDHKAYYPGATPMRFRVTGDLETGRILGAQLIGMFGAEISKRIDVFATAIFNEMTVDRVSDLDLSYTPPLSSPWDPVQMACQAWSKANTPTSGRVHV